MAIIPFHYSGFEDVDQVQKRNSRMDLQKKKNQNKDSVVWPGKAAVPHSTKKQNQVKKQA